MMREPAGFILACVFAFLNTLPFLYRIYIFERPIPCACIKLNCSLITCGVGVSFPFSTLIPWVVACEILLVVALFCAWEKPVVKEDPTVDNTNQELTQRKS